MVESFSERYSDVKILELSEYLFRWPIMKTCIGISTDFELLKQRQTVHYLQKRFKRIFSPEECNNSMNYFINFISNQIKILKNV